MAGVEQGHLLAVGAQVVGAAGFQSCQKRLSAAGLVAIVGAVLGPGGGDLGSAVVDVEAAVIVALPGLLQPGRVVHQGVAAMQGIEVQVVLHVGPLVRNDQVDTARGHEARKIMPLLERQPARNTQRQAGTQVGKRGVFGKLHGIEQVHARQAVRGLPVGGIADQHGQQPAFDDRHVGLEHGGTPGPVNAAAIETKGMALGLHGTHALGQKLAAPYIRHHIHRAAVQRRHQGQQVGEHGQQPHLVAPLGPGEVRVAPEHAGLGQVGIGMAAGLEHHPFAQGPQVVQPFQIEPAGELDHHIDVVGGLARAHDGELQPQHLRFVRQAGHFAHVDQHHAAHVGQLLHEHGQRERVLADAVFPQALALPGEYRNTDSHE